VKLYQTQEELECKLQGGQKIKINVGKELDLLLLLDQRRMY